MTRGKRPYVPKTRGCFECSNRRIHCDRGQPECGKCIAKGLKCSGLGIRYRFNDDVASKGRKSGKRESYPPTATFDTKTRSTGYKQHTTSNLHNDIDAGIDLELFGDDAGPRQRQYSSSESPDQDLPDFADFNLNSDDTDALEEILFPPSLDLVRINTLETSVKFHTTPCDIIEPWKKYFLSYFGNTIAPELVVIDDTKNGWRHLVLPLACMDSLVMDTVLSAATFHFTTNLNSQLYKPSAIYAKAIKRLQQRQNLQSQDTTGKQTVLLALLVLLATVMVNGFSDFPTVYNLLESALRAVGGEDAIEHGELGTFVLRQIRKYRGYAAPFLDHAEGLERLSLTTRFGQDAVNGWECFKASYQSHPEFSQHMFIIYELNRQACAIYVARATAGPDGPPLTDMVELFKETLDSFPTGSPGEHVLVWATFLAAAESRSIEHQEYFTDALLKHHRRNGFSNIPTALEYLQKIWSGQVSRDWTQQLPELQVFVV